MSEFVVEMAVGVENYYFQLTNACSCTPSERISVSISFAISGDLLKSAKSDSLDDTVNYDAICHKLEHVLGQFDCGDSQIIAATINNVIKNYSPRITDGYFSLLMTCHDTFRYAQRLL